MRSSDRSKSNLEALASVAIVIVSLGAAWVLVSSVIGFGVGFAVRAAKLVM